MRVPRDIVDPKAKEAKYKEFITTAIPFYLSNLDKMAKSNQGYLGCPRVSFFRNTILSVSRKCVNLIYIFIRFIILSCFIFVNHSCPGLIYISQEQLTILKLCVK